MNVVAIRDALVSHAQSLGMFAQVNGHEPKAAPADGLHGSLWLDEIGPARQRSGLDSTSVRLAYNFRVQRNMLAEPQDDTDPSILVAVSVLMTAYSGDFALGDEIAHIDLLGAYGNPLSARAGYLDQDQRLYRVMVLTIPLIVNDVFIQAP